MFGARLAFCHTHRYYTLCAPSLPHCVLKGWFYEGGGIYRHVTLTVADPLSITPWGVYLPSAVTGAITSGPLGVQGPQSATSASVMPRTDVMNARGVAATFTLSTQVYADGGVLVGTANSSETLAPGASSRYYQEVALSGSVQLWNTGPRPPLYVRFGAGSGGGPRVACPLRPPASARAVVYPLVRPATHRCSRADWIPG